MAIADPVNGCAFSIADSGWYARWRP
jgi:hypothetical protein